jgi:hypothetical protein
MIKTIGYWATTGLFSLAMLGSGIGDIVGAMDTTLAEMGYPWHFVRILGAWKVLGVVALLAPGFPLVKEWAYAGFFFAMTGAAISHIGAGQPVFSALPPVILLSFAVASYLLRPASRTVGPLTWGAQPASASVAGG